MIATRAQGGGLAATINPAVTSSDWRNALPVIERGAVTLRELRLSDAASLFEMLGTEEVARFISPPPTSVTGFERFIGWTHRERSAGRLICFGIVPDGYVHAVGIIQVRTLGPGFELAEWGFAIGSVFWGTGVFQAAAREVLAFAFTGLGTRRMEARSCVANGRGNGALQKMGATREGVLRKSFLREDVYHDQVIWSICADEWLQWRNPPVPAAH